MNRFLGSLHKKIKAKSLQYPDRVTDKGFSKIKNFHHFDERYTAPLHGFKNAKEYWRSNSSIYYIDKISIPTLLVNAKNDPFLTEDCFPVMQAQSNPKFFLEMPDTGGHCGFYEKNKNKQYWSEKRAIEFIRLYM
jgi:hypothetical protein